MSSAPDRNPHLEYQRRLEARRAATRDYARLDLRLSQARLGFFVLLLLTAALSLWRGLISAWWLAAPAAAFALVVVIHARVIERAKQLRNAVVYYEKGLARIEDRWIELSGPTDVLADEAHPYAADLDLFGKGSLFALLCTARTRAGRETLARWLMEPASRDEILSRQQAIEELRLRVDVRERLAVFGPEGASNLQLESLIAWATAPSAFRSRWPRLAASIASAFVLATLAALLWSEADRALAAYSAAVAGAAVLGLWLRTRVKDVIARAEGPRRELSSLAYVLLQLEQEHLHSKKVDTLRTALDDTRLRPTRRIAQLNRVLDLCDLKKCDPPAALLFIWFKQLVVAPCSFLFWLTHIACAVESWRASNGSSIREWIRISGEFDALCALAAYAYEHPDDPFPDVVEPGESGPCFEGDDLRHPLIPARLCVPNSVRLGHELRLLIVSGSNMSGKSTLLRTVGINAVLALAGAPVRATRLRVSPLAIGATIRIHDSIQAGTSRFYAEIGRIHAIVKQAAAGAPVLFLFDELLHGTNSHDRAVGAASILRELIDQHAIGLATTHDLSLAHIADTLAPRAGNVHFRDEFSAGRMTFDYKMYPGPAPRSNALALMLAMGLKIDAPADPPR